MSETLYLKENEPYPNNELPVLYYPGAIEKMTDSPEAGQEVKAFLEKNGYSNGWLNGIYSYHHFHSNTHEVLACISGEAMVQLGGPESETYLFQKGDVLLLPAGTAHKRIESTDDFQIVGAYPDGIEPDLQKGHPKDYRQIKKTIAGVPVPKTDPVKNTEGAVFEHWA